MTPLPPGRILSAHLKKDREDDLCDQRGRGKQDIGHCVRVKTFRTQCLKHPVSVSVVHKITTHHGAAVAEKPRQAARRVQHPRVAAASSVAQCCVSEIREVIELLLGRSEEVNPSKGTTYVWTCGHLFWWNREVQNSPEWQRGS